MNFCSPDAGACGTVIFWKHVGQSITVPACDESHLMCWPHTGQAYLNSLMLHGKHSTSARRWQCGFSRFDARPPGRGAAKRKNALRLGVFAPLR
jgi:hypothetical protein